VIHAILVSEQHKGIFVIGDIHGCYDELQSLHQKAVMEHNDGITFQYVISVGNLVNKGPKTTDRWFTVRGNHEDWAVEAAVGDEVQLSKNKYQFVINNGLTDEYLKWMSELPCSIRIPGSLLGDDEVDTVIVHAGLIPVVAREEQTIQTMVTIRKNYVIDNKSGKSHYSYSKKNEKRNSSILGKRYPWASVRKGPYRVIFGHDSRRGLQRCDENDDWAIGLDTGVCYGKKLTGIILPERKLVQVDAIEAHCPIK
jgi:bis(5'-nucleosyl)-tetraphosphatase (symmetrical)